MLSSLERFYVAATFYPSAHSRCQGALGDLNSHLDRLLSEDQTLVLELADGGCRVQGVFVDLDHPGAQFCLNLLGSMGIARFEFDRNTPMNQLHAAVCTLNSLKLESESCLHFHTLDFSALPGSVRVVQRQFGRGRAELGGKVLSAGDLNRSLDSLTSALDELPWPKARKEEFRRKAETFLIKTIERMDLKNHDQHVQSSLGHRSLEEVLDLGTSAISRAVDLLGVEDTGQDIENLFRNAADALALSEDSESVELMLDVLQESPGGPEDNPGIGDGETFRRDDTEYSRSLDDLVAAVTRIQARSSSAGPMVISPEREFMAICLQLLADGVDAPFTRGTRARISRAVSGPVSDQLVADLEESLETLFAGGDRRPIDAIVPLLLPQMIATWSDRFADLLSRQAPPDEPDRLALLWPHLVGLMLQPNPPTDPVLTGTVGRMLASMPSRLQDQECQRLNNLAIAGTGEIGDGLFRLPPDANRAVLKALLSTRLGLPTGKALFRHWSRAAPSELVRVLVAVLGPYSSGHRNLYRELLDNPDPDAQTASFRKTASSILAEGIRKQGRTDHQTEWLPAAIENLGRLGQMEFAPLLRDILCRRRLFVLYAWPRECRSSARKALQLMNDVGEG